MHSRKRPIECDIPVRDLIGRPIMGSIMVTFIRQIKPPAWDKPNHLDSASRELIGH